MNKTIDQKTKTKLYLISFVIAVGLIGSMFYPGIRLGTREETEQENHKIPLETSQLTRESPAGAAEIYLGKINQSDEEERYELLGMRNPLIMGQEIMEVTGTENKANVQARLYVGSSDLDVTLDLEKEGSDWEVISAEFANKLSYEESGVRIDHGKDWVVFSKSLVDDMDEGFMLQHTQTEDRIIIIPEPEFGAFTDYFVDCSEEVVTDCDTIEIDGREVKTSIYEGVARIYQAEEFSNDLAGRKVIAFVEGGQLENINQEALEIVASSRFF